MLSTIVHVLALKSYRYACYVNPSKYCSYIDDIWRQRRRKKNKQKQKSQRGSNKNQFHNLIFPHFSGSMCIVHHCSLFTHNFNDNFLWQYCIDFSIHPVESRFQFFFCLFSPLSPFPFQLCYYCRGGCIVEVAQKSLNEYEYYVLLGYCMAIWYMNWISLRGCWVKNGFALFCRAICKEFKDNGEKSRKKWTIGQTTDCVCVTIDIFYIYRLVYRTTIVVLWAKYFIGRKRHFSCQRLRRWKKYR